MGQGGCIKDIAACDIEIWIFSPFASGFLDWCVFLHFLLIFFKTVVAQSLRFGLFTALVV